MSDLKLNVNKFNEKYYWDHVNENLHCSFSSNFQPKINYFDLDKNYLDIYKKLLIHEGYLKLPELNWQDTFYNVRDGIIRLKSLNIPPPFIFTYCEPWMLLTSLNKIIKNLLGDEYIMLPEFWAWFVDPKKQDAGWGPHRDKGRKSLFNDGKPMSLTIWIPLTDATLDNSCMYLVPANRDSSYLSDELKITDMQSVVALPVKARCPLIWNSNVIHWGSRSLPRNVSPRISIAFEVQILKTEPFNKPTINPLVIPSFEQRLKLVSKQILQYSHMYPLDPDLEVFAKDQLKDIM